MKKHNLSIALRALKNGEVIIYPTDTLYALGADIYNNEAVRKVFDMKHRPYSIPLPVAVATEEQMETIAIVDDRVKRVIKRFLPGTLTIVLQKKKSVPALVTSGLENIAVRIPNNTIALELLEQFGPLTVTSANLHSEKTPGVIKDVQMQLGTHISVCLDDGRLEAVPSTIVDLTTTTPRIVRSGSITEKQIRDAITHE